jgi:hypothetical protein
MRVRPLPEPPKTRERILEIAKDHGLDEIVFLQEIKRCNCNGPFKESYWKEYLQVILNWEFFHRSMKTSPPSPCPVCGARQIYDPRIVRTRLLAYTFFRCEKDKHHYYMEMEAARQASYGTISFEEALQLRIKLEAK